jgi:dTDP-4-amino-4,6-dideoxygalactose transaminase
MPVHLEGVACDMEALRDIASRHKVAIVEDACQSLGTTYRGRHVGTFGDFGAFSLQLEKNVTSGEGGALVTDDEMLLVRAARYSDQGGQFVTSYGVERGDELTEPFAGENLRMTEIAGAIAEQQLRKLPSIIEAFRANKQKILGALGTIHGLEPRSSHDSDGDGASSLTWFLPSSEIARRFAKALRAEGIPAGPMYNAKPVYSNPAILAKRTATGKGGPWNCAEHPTDVEYSMGMCPRTEALITRSFAVGNGAAFSPSDCEDIAAAIGKVASHLL